MASRSTTRQARRATTTVALAAALVVSLATAAVANFGDGLAVGANAFSTEVLQPPTALALVPTCAGGSGGGVPTFVSTARATGFGNSVTLNTPSGTVAGDLLLAQIAADDTTSVSAAGWTLIRQDRDSGEGFWAASLYRIAGASEPASHTFALTQAITGEWGAGVSTYRGVDAGDPINAQGGQITSSFISSVTAPSVTPTVANTRLVAFFGRDGGQVLNAPGSLTERWGVTVTSPQDAAAMAADQSWPVPGPTGTRVATTSGTNNGIGHTVALTPAPFDGVAGVDASWSATPSGFASGYRLQRWRNGVLEDEQAVSGAGTVAAADQPVAAGTTYEYRLFAEYENWTSPVVTASVATACDAVTATALWRHKADNVGRFSHWDGASWSADTPTANVGEWRIMQAAPSTTRDEVVAVGVTQDAKITAMMRSGGTWAEPFGASLGAPSQTFWWGADVAYESASGEAMLVWNNGSAGSAGLSYRVWDGADWSPEATVTTPVAGEPQQLHLAADPTSDEMVLVVSNDASQDYALVWDGASWVGGSSIVLDPGSGNDRTDVNVAYEAQTGRAVVVYAQGAGVPGTNVRYRTWDGSWSGQASLSPPGGLAGAGAIPRWTALAADPGTDRLALGVTTFGGDLWVATWSGTGWNDETLASTTAAAVDAPVVAVAFEGPGGDALATYGEGGTNAVRYRTWAAGGGWSAEAVGPDLGKRANSMTLDARPAGGQVALLVQDDQQDLNAVLWDGSGWGALTVLDVDTNETKNQPFAWVWD